jgi:hypothetical protein
MRSVNTRADTAAAVSTVHAQLVATTAMLRVLTQLTCTYTDDTCLSQRTNYSPYCCILAGITTKALHKQAVTIHLLVVHSSRQ